MTGLRLIPRAFGLIRIFSGDIEYFHIIQRAIEYPATDSVTTPQLLLIISVNCKFGKERNNPGQRLL